MSRLVVDGTMRRVTGDAGRLAGGNHTSLHSAATFFRFVAERAGLPAAADDLIHEYVHMLGGDSADLDDSVHLPTSGLTSQEYESLSTVCVGGTTSADFGGECVVCFSAFSDGQPVKVLPCQHAFCEACTSRWMESNTTCPMCRCDCKFVNGFKPFKPKRRSAAPPAALADGASVEREQTPAALPIPSDTHAAASRATAAAAARASLQLGTSMQPGPNTRAGPNSSSAVSPTEGEPREGARLGGPAGPDC